ncbi:hypothetical protein FRC15_004737 [Serendipita sp. 397]|nr:hypothetical protein FRC15_004737 [Serendipita sp. 397]
MDFLDTLFDFPVVFDEEEFFRQLAYILPLTFMPEDLSPSPPVDENRQSTSQLPQLDALVSQDLENSAYPARNGNPISRPNAVPGSSMTLSFMHPSLVVQNPSQDTQIPTSKPGKTAPALVSATPWLPISGGFAENRDNLSSSSEESDKINIDDEEEDDEEEEEEEEIDEIQSSSEDESEDELETQQPPPKRRRLSSGGGAGEQRREKGWKNSIRHHLSLSACFVKQEKDIMETGKGVWWTVDESVTGGTKRARKRRPRSKKAIAAAQAAEEAARADEIRAMQMGFDQSGEKRSPSPVRPGWDKFGPTNDLLEMSMDFSYPPTRFSIKPHNLATGVRSSRRITAPLSSKESMQAEPSQPQTSDPIQTIIQLPGYEALLSLQNTQNLDSVSMTDDSRLERGVHDSSTLPSHMRPISKNTRVQPSSIIILPTPGSSSRDRQVVSSISGRRNISSRPEKRGIFDVDTTRSDFSTGATKEEISTSAIVTGSAKDQHRSLQKQRHQRGQQNERPSAMRSLPARIYNGSATVTFRDAASSSSTSTGPSRSGAATNSATTGWQGTSGLHFAAAHYAPVSTRLKARTDFAFPATPAQSNDEPIAPPLLSVPGRFSPFSDVTSNDSSSE